MDSGVETISLPEFVYSLVTENFGSDLDEIVEHLARTLNQDPTEDVRPQVEMYIALLPLPRFTSWRGAATIIPDYKLFPKIHGEFFGREASHVHVLEHIIVWTNSGPLHSFRLDKLADGAVDVEAAKEATIEALLVNYPYPQISIYADLIAENPPHAAIKAPDYLVSNKLPC